MARWRLGLKVAPRLAEDAGSTGCRQAGDPDNLGPSWPVEGDEADRFVPSPLQAEPSITTAEFGDQRFSIAILQHAWCRLEMGRLPRFQSAANRVEPCPRFATWCWFRCAG